MAYCSNCGSELKDGAKFCDKCGSAVKQTGSAQQNTNVSGGTICKKCGSTVPFGNAACPKCGTPINQNDYNTVIIIGYIVTVLISLFLPVLGLIIGICFGAYLLTRDDESVKKHGIIMIVIPIAILFIQLVFVGLFLSFYY